jgi:hypothetical protein
VLRKYGLAYLQDDAKRFSHWVFTVPSPENLKKLAEAFALVCGGEGLVSVVMSLVFNTLSWFSPIARFQGGSNTLK